MNHYLIYQKESKTSASALISLILKVGDFDILENKYITSIICVIVRKPVAVNPQITSGHVQKSWPEPLPSTF